MFGLELFDGPRLQQRLGFGVAIGQFVERDSFLELHAILVPAANYRDGYEL